MTYRPPYRDQQPSGAWQHQDGPGTGAAVTLPGLGPSSIATIPVTSGSVNSLIGLLAYVMLSPPPAGGTRDQDQNLKSTLAYLTSRADALCRTGRGHLVQEAEADRARHARVSDDPYVPQGRSYVGGTVRDAVGYLCPVIAEEAGQHRPAGNGNGGSGPHPVIEPDPPR